MDGHRTGPPQGTGEQNPAYRTAHRHMSPTDTTVSTLRDSLHRLASVISVSDMRTGLVLVALLPLAACSGGPSDQEVAACEGFRSIETEIDGVDLMQADPDAILDLLNESAEVSNSAEESGNVALSEPADTMTEELGAWPLPRFEREFQPAFQEMDAACSALDL